MTKSQKEEEITSSLIISFNSDMFPLLSKKINMLLDVPGI
jgi:hypothetical protein